MAHYFSKCRNLMHLLNPQKCSVASIKNKRRPICTFSASQSHKELDSLQNEDQSQVLDHPGGRVKFTSKLDFIPDSPQERIPCYRVLDENGVPTCDNFDKIPKDVAVKMYTNMVTLQTMDSIFYEAQRQGRISFYLTTLGEEAINIASAAALHMDDIVFPQGLDAINIESSGRSLTLNSKVNDRNEDTPALFNKLEIFSREVLNRGKKYREPGVLLWRGFTLEEFANQCFGNKDDKGKGRQMPAHYGSKEHNYVTVASTVATQIPHAVGAAYALKLDRLNACAITYFGDGGTSTGDFHAALNFAAVMGAPVLLFCRNNGWAISTPLCDQFRSDGIVVRGQAYGIRGIRVDGNDAIAVYNAVHTARELAVSEQAPVLIEALTYRAGHHTTSDDSSKYREAEEIKWWRDARDPVTRFRKWLEREGWWNVQSEVELRPSLKKQVLHALQAAEKVEKPPIADMFTDVYDATPSNLREQEANLQQTIRRHSKDYPSGFAK